MAEIGRAFQYEDIVMPVPPNRNLNAFLLVVMALSFFRVIAKAKCFAESQMDVPSRPHVRTRFGSAIHDANALLDSGADVNLIRDDVYEALGYPGKMVPFSNRIGQQAKVSWK